MLVYANNTKDKNLLSKVKKYLHNSNITNSLDEIVIYTNCYSLTDIAKEFVKEYEYQDELKAMYNNNYYHLANEFKKYLDIHEIEKGLYIEILDL